MFRSCRFDNLAKLNFLIISLCLTPPTNPFAGELTVAADAPRPTTRIMAWLMENMVDRVDDTWTIMHLAITCDRLYWSNWFCLNYRLF